MKNFGAAPSIAALYTHYEKFWSGSLTPLFMGKNIIKKTKTIKIVLVFYY